MAEGRWSWPGGILGLAGALDDNKVRESLERDLIVDGLRLRWFLKGGDPDHTLRDLIIYIKHAPENTALYSAIVGDEEAMWGLSEQLLAAAIDHLAVMLWFQTKDGSKGINRPKPIPRPGVENEEKTVIKGTAKPVGEVSSRLGMNIL